MARPNPLTLLGARIREVRKTRGLNQEEVGERADLHRNEIGVIERGETNITFVNLLRVCRALRITPAELLQPFTLAGIEKLPAKRVASHRREK